MSEKQKYFLHYLEGFTVYDEGPSQYERQNLVSIYNDANEPVCQLYFEPSLPAALNKIIERAKEWIRSELKVISAASSFKQNKSITMDKPVLQMVKLGDIVPSKTNNFQREAWEFDESALKELTDSISQKGVIQPVMLRPDGKPGKYYLVCGERRFNASKLAGLEEIPAYIKTLSDEEAFDLQITENLQRKDVHPMKEAQAYKALMDANKKNTVAELAHRFGKTEAYITQRLSFNTLIPEMRKEFFEGKMLIGHAILFARLTVVDQKEALKNCKENYGPEKGQYESIEDVKEWIEDEIMHELGQAPFDKKDEKLVAKAGSCTNCPKRSGGNLLFSDVKEKDRCFDGKCYADKKIAHTIKQINELVLTEPAMPVVKMWGTEKSVPEVQKLLADNKVKILVKYDDFDEASKKDKSSTMALCIAGNEMGSIVGIKFKGTEKAKAARAASAESDKEVLTAEAIDEQINGIKERLKRSAELDEDKVHARITERLVGLKPYTDVAEEHTDLLNTEYDALVYLAYEHTGYEGKKKIDKLLNVKKTSSYREQEIAIAEAISVAPAKMKCFIVRSFIANEYVALNILPSMKSPKAWLVRRVAEGYPGIPVHAYEQEQKTAREKREDSAKKRITALQEKKKEITDKKSTKKSAKK
jgi:ParB/RepB/Spo0J family partition protein